MPWLGLSAAGTSRQAWFRLAIPGGGRLSDVVLPDGRNLRSAVRLDGPTAHQAWFEQVRDSGGTALTDMLWDTSASGVKVVSDRLAECLTSLDDSLLTESIRVVDRAGASVPGYVCLLESVGRETPVHSTKGRTRGSELVVSEEVAERVRAEAFVGLRITPVDSAYPGDEPL